MRRSFLLLSVFYQIIFCFGANLLFLNGVPSPSHQHWNRHLAEGLAHRSHNITIMSPIKMENQISENINYIHMEKTYAKMYGGKNPVNHLDRVKQSPLDFVIEVAKIKIKTCEGILESDGLNTILNYPEDFQFDAILYDFHYGPCLLPLLQRFKFPPLIAVSAFNAPSLRRGLVGGHFYPGYVPFFTMRKGANLNFCDRVYSNFLHQFEYYYQNLIFLPKIERMVQARYQFKNMTSVVDLERRTTIMLLNQDYALDVAQSLQPNIIQVGGLHIAEPKTLKEDLRNFIETGKQGSLVMSLGTNLKSSMLSADLITIILTTFEELSKYNFVWKFEADELPLKKPKNVYISKYLPQNDILAHPNIKAFITHAGWLSTQESLWYGKPIIGIPFFGDQYRNLDTVIQLGAGEKLDFQDITVENLKRVILKVLEDPSYTKNAQQISKRFQDKPEMPLDKAVWWIEYVLRNPQPDHLRSPTLELGIFISNGYDVLVFIFLVFMMILYLTMLVTFKLLSIIFDWAEHYLLRTITKVVKID